MSLTPEEQSRLIYLESQLGKCSITELEHEIARNQEILDRLPTGDIAHRRFASEVKLYTELKDLVVKQAQTE